jgi:maltooligosyltrehalose trehalohydrolase
MQELAAFRLFAPTENDRPTLRRHRMRFGAEVEAEGVRFRLWAPKHDRVVLEIEGEHVFRPMRALGDGWHELRTDAARPGSLYRFVFPDGHRIPDTASRFQPRDVHGPSEVIDPAAYIWRDTDWRGRPWEEAVVYELHVGAFTREGTFRAAAEKLDDLAALGVTAVQLMPLGDFPGERNWGYDGVQLFAPDSSYGRPEDLKAFVDAAHLRGLMVFLDVVYNHFGPEGNYLPACAPIFTDRHHTAWGMAVNYDAEGSDVVRELVVSNALYWIEEFHMDGLRLDAVHAIADDSATHVLNEIADAVHAAAGDRAVHLILENEENTASLLARDEGGGPRHYTAQWNDDLHHVLHAAASGEDAGYYGDYVGNTERLGRALAEGFAFQGETMPYRGRPRGEPSAALPPSSFVAFIQNHDQVGNRAFGDRITRFASPEAVRAISAVYLLSPQIPMLFMGEEWAASSPFLFFCDFEPQLAAAVREGRRKEFARFPEFQDAETRERIPDPSAPETFLASKLDWGEAEAGAHVGWREHYRRLLEVRRTELTPRLQKIRGHAGRHDILRPGAVSVSWTLGDGSVLRMAANLSDAPLTVSHAPQGRILWECGEPVDSGFGPWMVIVTLTEAEPDGG